MTSMHPDYDAIRMAVAGFHNPTIFMEKTEKAHIVKARRDAMLLMIATCDYDDAVEWNKLSMANGFCYQAYNAGIKSATKLKEAQAAVERHLRADDGTEIWSNQLDFLHRRVADSAVRLEDQRMTYRAATEVYALVAQEFIAAGHEVEAHWHTPESRRQAEKRKRVRAEMLTPDTGPVFNNTRYGAAA